MLFYTLLPILLLGATAYAQQELDSAAPTSAVEQPLPKDQLAAEPQEDAQVQGRSITVTELDTSEPMLWQMAAFAARQMSTKQRRMKLATLTAAEQIDSLYRLKVTLQRVNEGQPIDKNDVLYCTVEVKSNAQGQQWEVDNFGCTLPALVRRRRPQKKVQALETVAAEPITTNKFESPIDNVISDNQIDSNDVNMQQQQNSIVAKTQVKRQTRPYYQVVQQYQQPAYVQPAFYPQYPMYYQAYY